MSITLLTSICGAPGVSTTALGLALAWPTSSLLVDTDAHQAVLAGYLRAQEAPEPNLSNVAAAAQRTGDLRSLVWEKLVRPLPDDTEVRRRMYLPGPATPWARAAIEARWSSIIPVFDGLAEAGIDTIIDLGRLIPPTTPAPRLIAEPLIQAAASTLVMLDPTLPAIAAARVMAEGLHEQADRFGVTDRLGLILRRPPLPRPHRAQVQTSFSGKDVEKALGLPVVGTVAHDQVAAAHLSEGAEQRAFPKSSLSRSLSQLATSLHDLAEIRVTSVLEEPHAR